MNMFITAKGISKVTTKVTSKVTAKGIKSGPDATPSKRAGCIGQPSQSEKPSKNNGLPACAASTMPVR